MVDLLEAYGLSVLFLIVALESAGVPLPGETALIAASFLAAQGHLELGPVIGLSALAAIAGDNLGYWIGRLGGRPLFERRRLLARYAEQVLPPAERFFARHGGKTIFLARFISGLRAAAALMAGISRMDWWLFTFWNAAGGMVWATTIGLGAFYCGRAADGSAGRIGLVLLGAGSMVALLGAVYLHRARQGRRQPASQKQAPDAPPASSTAMPGRRRSKRLLF
jgi:membrane protein DedA with SNARE-associated domain